MDRIEPSARPDLQGITFRQPPRWAAPASDGRFGLGVAIFLVVALAYPWYAYWVQSHLLARDLQAGVEEFSASMDKVDGQLRAGLAESQQRSRETQQQTIDGRIAAVRVTGVSEGDPPLVIVQVGGSNVWESRTRVCSQGEAWLERSLSRRRVRVQAVHPSGRAGEIQELACP